MIGERTMYIGMDKTIGTNMFSFVKKIFTKVINITIDSILCSSKGLHIDTFGFLVLIFNTFENLLNKIFFFLKNYSLLMRLKLVIIYQIV